jgi:poly-gamma-glutamate synthesis protein (capsule biosynthesis protein)
LGKEVGKMKLIAVGDVMPGGVLNSTKDICISEDVKETLCSADLVIATLETAVGNEPSFYDEKMKRLGDVIYVEDDDLVRLKELNVGIVSLANNHFFDLGIKGAKHTIDLLDQMGIKHCGAGMNLPEASKPVVVKNGGETFAFLAFCDWREEHVGWCPFASENAPGVNPMNDDYALTEIRKYAQLYDNVIVISHWGKEYSLWPKPKIVSLSKRMLDAGATLVLGGHTHCVQPILKRKNKAVVYSMGNFLFPDRLITKPRSTYYPHPSLDVSKLPKTDGYPYVEEPTLKIWKLIARYGMIASISLNKKQCLIDCSYTNLTRDNKVVLNVLPNNIQNELKYSHLFLTFPFYIFFYYFKILLFKVYRKTIMQIITKRKKNSLLAVRK